MTKRKYEALEIKIIKLQAQDVIATSTEEFYGEWMPLNCD